MLIKRKDEWADSKWKVDSPTLDRSVISGDAGWRHVMRDLKDGKLNLESPTQLFDHLGHQGVLLLNTSLTVGVERSGAKRRAPRGHFPLWRPLIQRVLSCVASRRDQYAVFLLWGQHARGIVDQSGVRATAERLKTWGTRVTAISHPHPAAITSQGAIFLRPPNPFLAANRALRKLGAEPIRW
ncbi:MAG: hypothetical protein DMG76_00560 [Acidobacteria bacterium]|nr:MAG: hypothetical protein DMG76_00560 [Acidobacteriota bacterium]